MILGNVSLGRCFTAMHSLYHRHYITKAMTIFATAKKTILQKRNMTTQTTLQRRVDNIRSTHSPFGFGFQPGLLLFIVPIPI